MSVRRAAITVRRGTWEEVVEGYALPIASGGVWVFVPDADKEKITKVLVGHAKVTMVFPDKKKQSAWLLNREVLEQLGEDVRNILEGL